ncbi:MAG: phage tail sheath C-terminal domain-containing protein [Candidatus Nanopelagicaceae bacterium]
MATPQLSPGVLIREVDLTVGRIDNIVDNIGAIAGPFVKGPVEDPVTIETEEELIRVFGKPQSTDGQYEYWMTASSFLSYGGIVKVVRTDGETIVNSSTRTAQQDEITTLTATYGSAESEYLADDARTEGVYQLSQTNGANILASTAEVGYGFTVSSDDGTASPGSGAIISVGIGTTGEIVSLSVINGGSGYESGDIIYINDGILGNTANDNPIRVVVDAIQDAAESVTADPELKIKNLNDYSGTEGDVIPYMFAGKNPGTWSNNLTIAVIDDKADQILNVGGVAATDAQVGFGVTVSIDQVRRPVRRTGRNDAGGGFFTENGYLKAIITGKDATLGTIDVKITSKVASDGTETPIEYKNRSRHASFKPGNQIVISNSSGVGVATVTLDQGSDIKDWYNEQFIALETGSVSWKSIAQKPTTNQWVADRKGRNDALHIAIFDDLGTVSGIKGNLLEKHTSLSKSLDAISAINPPQRLFYKDYLAVYSEYIFAGANPSDISNNEVTYASGFLVNADGTYTWTPIPAADGLWFQEGKERTFAVVGPKLYKLTGGKDYTPELPASSADPVIQAQIVAVNNAATVSLASTSTTGSLKATLGQVLNAYDYFADKDEIAVDFLLMGPGLDDKEESQAKAQNLIAIAEDRGDCIACISPHRTDVLGDGLSFVSTDDITDNVVEFFSTLASSSYAVFDSGYKYMYDRFNNAFRYVPCNGDVAGLMVRTSLEAYPWYSPAGQQRGILNNAVKLAYNPNKAQRDTLYTARVNPIITQSGLGTLLFGDKTALGYASAFDRINVRRLFLYIEQSLQKLADAQLFEINDNITRANFVSLVDPFLAEIQAKRGLYGYLIVCDESNNTPDLIDNNEFRADIYLKPTKSINYVTLTFVATRTGVSFGEVAGTV